MSSRSLSKNTCEICYELAQSRMLRHARLKPQLQALFSCPGGRRMRASPQAGVHR